MHSAHTHTEIETVEGIHLWVVQQSIHFWCVSTTGKCSHKWDLTIVSTSTSIFTHWKKLNELPMCYNAPMHTHTHKESYTFHHRLFLWCACMCMAIHRMLSNINSMNYSYIFWGELTFIRRCLFAWASFLMYRRLQNVCTEKSNMQIDALSSGNFNKKK